MPGPQLAPVTEDGCQPGATKDGFVKPTKTMPSIRRTTKQNILKLIGFAIKRYTEHVMQLILHKLGQELKRKSTRLLL